MMSLEEYAVHDATGLADLVRHGEISAAELLALGRKAVARINPSINAIVAQIDPAIIGELTGPMFGVPFLIKDLVLQARGVPQAMGSRILKGDEFVADHDSELFRRFRAAGLVTFGRTATPELGFNTTTESQLSGPTRNPWNLEHSAGGSSGGAAAAIASGIVPVAHGNDGGGSIRIPATVNGLVGLKPSRMRVPVGPDFQIPLHGMGVEFALSRTVRDCALLLDATAGPEPGAFVYMASPSAPYVEVIRRPARSLRIALAPSGFRGIPEPDPDIAALVMQAGSALEGLGHYVEMIDCIPFESAAFHAAARRIWCANLSNVAHQLAVAKGVKPCADYFEACTLTCIEAGARLSALDMEDALATMTRISLAMATAFARYDAIILPPARTISPRIGYLNQNTTGMSADAYYDLIFDIYPYTGPFNMTGQPAISLPTGHVRGLPVGVQIAAAMAREDTLLSLAAELEVVLPWKDRRPLVHVSVAQ